MNDNMYTMSAYFPHALPHRRPFFLIFYSLLKIQCILYSLVYLEDAPTHRLSPCVVSHHFANKAGFLQHAQTNDAFDYFFELFVTDTGEGEEVYTSVVAYCRRLCVSNWNDKQWRWRIYLPIQVYLEIQMSPPRYK